MAGDVVRTLRQSGRGLRRSPGLTLVVIATLAVGVGAVTAAFSVVDAVLLRPLPYRDAQRGAMVWSSWKGFPQTWVSWDEAELYRTAVPAFAAVGLYLDGEPRTLGGERPERVRTAAVDAHVFRALGVEPAVGRGFLAAEDRPGAEPVVVLAAPLWQRRFAGDPGVVGEAVDLDGVAHRVVGVMPAGFRLPTDYGSPEPSDLWVPLAGDPADYEATPGPAISPYGGSHTFFAVARLAKGATMEQANRQLATVVERLRREGVYPAEWGFQASAVTLPQQVTGELRPALRVVLASALLVLLVACANVVGVLLARSERRRGEVGLRAALGGGARGLASLALGESVWLGLGAAAVGALLAAGAVGLLRSAAPLSLPRVAEAGVDVRVLAVAAVVALLAALAAAGLPLLHALRVDPATLLRQSGARGGVRSAAMRGRQALVAGQAALTVLTLCAAGLMVRSMENLLAVDLGFEPQGAVATELSLPSTRYPREQVAATFEGIVRRIRALPGVDSAGLVRVLPLHAEIGDRGMQVAGYQPAAGEAVAAEWQVADGGYFAALGLRRVAGRLLDVRDGPDAAPVAVVNESFARRYFAGREAVGGRLMLGGEAAPRTIVGVVADTRVNSITEEVKPRFYAPHGQGVFRQRTMHLVLRSDRDVAELAPVVRATLAGLDPQLAASPLVAMEDVLTAATAPSGFLTGMLGLLGSLAVALGAVGTYGLVAQGAASRRREVGVRVAVGARPGHVAGLVAREGAVAIAAGTLLGSGLALLLPRVLGDLLWAVEPADPRALLAAWAVMLGAAAVAAAGPAWRATRADVVLSLRDE